MAKSLTPVAASEVRAFFQANPKVAQEVAEAAGVATNSVLGADGDASRIRGRINPAFTAHFNETQAPKHYQEVPKGGIARTPLMVTVPRTGANGRALKAVEVERSEALRLLGYAENRKGSLSSADLAKVGTLLPKRSK